MAATVDTSTPSGAVAAGMQRKCFYAVGLFWAFFSNGTNAGWEFSADGTTWTGVFTSIGACLTGNDFSIWFDGTYIHYTRFANYDLFYRRGTPVNDGTITWSAVEQTVHDGANTNHYSWPSITVDTNGYAWIGVHHDQPDGDDFPVVLKNDNLDGTWTLDFAYELNAIDDVGWKICPVPLTDGKVYVIYCDSARTPFGKLYNAGWGAEENDLADFNIEMGFLYSAVAIEDDIHFVYNRDITNQIRHNIRVFGVGWNAADVLVQDTVEATTGPALSSDPSEGDLYCFWTSSVTDHVYYKQYTGGAWDLAATDWIDETADDIWVSYLLSSFYMDYGSFVGLLYVSALGPTFKVRFAFLTTPSGWTGTIAGVTDPASIMGVAKANIASVKGVA